MFPNRGPQLMHHVRIPDETKTIFAHYVAYDTMIAVSPGWDYITEENAEASIALLTPRSWGEMIAPIGPG